MRRRRSNQSILITEAQISQDDELAARKKRYLITMTIRALCLVAAAVSIKIVWLALLFCALGAVLPWIAVLVANDRPPKKAEKVSRFRGGDGERSVGPSVRPGIMGGHGPAGGGGTG